MTFLLIETMLLYISTIFNMKGFWVLQLSFPIRQERESEQIRTRKRVRTDKNRQRTSKQEVLY
jgi:hypothetical protein